MGSFFMLCILLLGKQQTLTGGMFPLVQKKKHLKQICQNTIFLHSSIAKRYLNSPHWLTALHCFLFCKCFCERTHTKYVKVQ